MINSGKIEIQVLFVNLSRGQKARLQQEWSGSHRNLVFSALLAFTEVGVYANCALDINKLDNPHSVPNKVELSPRE